MRLPALLACLPLLAGCADRPRERVLEPDPSALVAALGSGSFRDREEAQAQLLEMGDRVRPLLEERLQDPDAEVRARVSTLLSALRREPFRKLPLEGLKQEFPDILEVLHSEDPDRARISRLLLGLRWSADPAVPRIACLLLEAGHLEDLDSHMNSVHNACLLDLARTRPDPALADVLAGLLGTLEGPGPRLAVASLLAELGGAEAGPALAALLEDPDVRTRSFAALALARLGKPEGRAALEGSLRGEDGQARFFAAELLGALRGPGTVRTLLPLLLEEPGLARSGALHGLGRSGSPEAGRAILEGIRAGRLAKDGDAFNALIDLASPELCGELLSEYDRAVRTPAFDVEPFMLAQALANTGDVSAVPRLVDRHLAAPKDTSTLVLLARLSLEGALAELRRREDPEASRLLDYVGRDRAFRDARALLRRLQDPDALNDPDALLAVIALGHRGKPQDIPLLRELLRRFPYHFNSDPTYLTHFQKETVLALGRLGDPDILPMLRRLKDDPCEACRRRAGAILKGP